MSQSVQFFPQEVIEKIGNYVYRLIDPRNGETFYIGKGKGNRVFDHVNGTMKDRDPDSDLSFKEQRIMDIRNAGLEVLHVIHRHEIPDGIVEHVEAALIDAFPGLTNAQAGHGSNSFGPMHVRELVDKYMLPVIDERPAESILFININDIVNRSTRDAVYQQVRGHWRLSTARASKTELVIATIRGVAVGVFRPDRWYPSPAYPGRYCFDGKEAEEAQWTRFVGDRGKRIVHAEMKHIQNPIRYWNC